MSRVLFELSYIGDIRGNISKVSVFIVLFFVYFNARKMAKTDKREDNRELARVVTKIIIVIMLVYTVFVIKKYIDVVIAYKGGNYIEVEGPVEGYHYSQGTEYFVLDGVRFECSNEFSWGYHPHGNNGCVAGNGQHLRIRYIPDRQGNTIVYIEQMMPEERDTN